MEYRLYFKDEKWGNYTRRIDLECADDAEAVRAAEDHKHEAAIELWQGTRLVGTFPAKSAAETRKPSVFRRLGRLFRRKSRPADSP